ncbi:MAG: hypothetical protein DMG57_36530 [Acidobacteria bacterium]|nr:MAG: hypothetical protein DMG57_36530 [Acidobacteriota bacterium]
MITVRQPEHIGCTALDAINRSAVIVMPAQRFLDWLRQADPTSAELSLEDLSASQRSTCFRSTQPKKRRARI